MNAAYVNNPNAHIHDRTSLNAMIADWTAKNGGPRRFPRGWSGEWFCLRQKMAELGYDIQIKTSMYSIKKIGAPGRSERMGRERALERIDEILIAHGKEPFKRRNEA